MQKINKYFLEALRASLKGKTVNWITEDISVEEFSQLYQISNMHNVLSMIFEATFSCEVAQKMSPQYMLMYRRNVIQEIAQQTMKSSEFQMLSNYLRTNGIKPCVVKGIVCRNLYPNPDARVSGDEDVFIPEEQFEISHKALIDYGMVLMEPEKDIEAIYEVPYVKPGSPLYIELHKHMFPPESDAYGNLNRFFDGIHDRTEKPHKGECGLIEEEINGTKFLTMNHADHLLYYNEHIGGIIGSSGGKRYSHDFNQRSFFAWKKRRHFSKLNIVLSFQFIIRNVLLHPACEVCFVPSVPT